MHVPPNIMQSIMDIIQNIGVSCSVEGSAGNPKDDGAHHKASDK